MVTFGYNGVSGGHMHDSELIIALKEEIGNPQLFTGRHQELNFLFDWVESVKKELGKSHVLLARKRRGKTALVQRFYNILFTRNDPKVIPFYYRVPDSPIQFEAYASSFFRSFLRQYLAFKLRRPDLLNIRPSIEAMIDLASDDPILIEHIQGVVPLLDKRPHEAWETIREFGHNLAAHKDERIIQIIDEFQYMSEMVIHNDKPINLCSGYQMTGSSPVSPQIITGSYIGWLSTIVNRMVGRYRGMSLGPLPPDEALATVYNYARLYQREIGPDEAAYLVELCYGDPYYIAQIFQSSFSPSTQLTREIIRKTLDYETRLIGGEITKMWGDYILSAIERVNDVNAKKIILFLAKNDDQEYTRKELLENLNLDISDHELEKRMTKLVKSDIIAQGSSNFRFRGLGDPIFELVFRRIYEEEINEVDSSTLTAEFEKRFASLEGKLSATKGLAAEITVRYRLLQIGRKKITPAKLSLEPVNWTTSWRFQNNQETQPTPRTRQTHRNRSLCRSAIPRRSRYGGRSQRLETPHWRAASRYFY